MMTNLSSSDPSVFSWLFITDDVLKEKSDSAGLKDGVKLTSVILSPDGRCAEGLLNPAEVSASRECQLMIADIYMKVFLNVGIENETVMTCYDVNFKRHVRA